MDFTVICICGNCFDGYFNDDDYVYEYYCGCGRHWVIPRPHEDKDDAPDK